MNKLVVLALVASLLTTAASFADTSGSSGLCGPNGPESFNRPGGYCEALGGKSLSVPLSGTAAALAPVAPVPPVPEEDDCLCAEGV